MVDWLIYGAMNFGYVMVVKAISFKKHQQPGLGVIFIVTHEQPPIINLLILAPWQLDDQWLFDG